MFERKMGHKTLPRQRNSMKSCRGRKGFSPRKNPVAAEKRAKSCRGRRRSSPGPCYRPGLEGHTFSCSGPVTSRDL